MTEETIFQEAITRGPGDRAAYLDQACAGKPELRAAVEALLAAHEKSGHMLDKSPGELGQTVDSVAGEPDHAASGAHSPQPDNAAAAAIRPTTEYTRDAEPGAVIANRYTLVEKIGEGGMGEVWVAKQTEPVKRKVALKLIKAGMDSRAVMQRFEQERQALALMDHPNIARVLDGGLTSDRRPFFVMELVNGLPLTKFCDDAKLGIRERLELFTSICQAVQHAHQKGIIHRDLKPANILVTIVDGRGVPKVIDFGVAKATSGRLTDESLSTQFGAVVGTLEYMSPEQAGFSGEDIDTRADVYSLGVILYELLTGLRPIDAARLRKAALTEMIRIIREEEPSKPSTRISTDASAPSIAALRQTEPKRLTAMLRRELDWVVLKCLEKQRDRRYETANALARDIQRYLAEEPVEARPQSAAYRLRKFAQRNKGPVIAAILVLAALLVGITGTTWALIEAKRQARIALAAQQSEAKRAESERLAADRERQARLEEQRQREIAEAIASFIRSDFLALTSVEGQERFGGPLRADLSKDTTLGELLDRAAERLRAHKDLDPHIEAELCWIVGVNYRGSGNAKKAIEFLERTVQLRTELFGTEYSGTLDAMNSLAAAYQSAGRPDLALPLNEQTLRVARAQFEPNHASTLSSLNNLAEVYRATGKLDLAMPLLEESVKVCTEVLGRDHSMTLASMTNLAGTYYAVGRLDQALPLFEESLQRKTAALGPDHTLTLTCMNNLALAYQDAGRLDLAEPLFEQSLKLTTAKLGPEHPGTLTTMHNLARFHAAKKRLDLAVPIFEQSLSLRRAIIGREHPDTLATMNSLAIAYHDSKKPDLARPLFEELLELQKATLAPDHPDTLATMNQLAYVYRDMGRRDLALPLFEAFVTFRTATLGPDHPRTISSTTNLGATYWELKHFDKSIPLFEDLVKRHETKLGRDHVDTLNALANLGVNFKDAGRVAEALPLLEEAYRCTRKYTALRWVSDQLLDGYIQAGKRDEAAKLVHELLADARKQLAPNSPELAGVLAHYSRMLLQMNGFSEAEPILRECLTIRQSLVPDDWSTFNTMSMLGGSLLGQNKHADAEPLLLAGYEGMKQRAAKIPLPARDRLPEAIERLVQLYEATGKPDEAAQWRKQLQTAPAAEQPPPENRP